jgi:serine/threonine protein phosphatase PrpC
MQASDEEAARNLVASALAAGGHDNISVIIVSVGAADARNSIAAAGASA